MRLFVRAALIFLAIAIYGCYGVRPSSGGAEANITSRKIDQADVALPAGYRIEVVAKDLTFPTGVTFDESGQAYVVESGYAYGEKWTEPRLLKVEASGKTSVIARSMNPLYQTRNWTRSLPTSKL